MDWSRLEVADVGHAAGLWQAAGFWALVFLTIWLGVFAAMVACGVQEIGGQRRATWGVKVICITHHLLTGPLALAALLQDPIVAKALTCLGCEEAAWSMARDTSLGPPPGVRALMPITLGYMLGDLALLPCWGAWGPEGRRVARADDAIMIAHHALSIAIWPMTVYYNYCSRYVLIMISTEFSSIFMTCNWFLTTLGRKSDLIYKVNGLIFTLTFVVVRMVGAVPQLVAMFRVPPWTMSTMRAVAPDVDIQWWQVYACSAMVLPHCLNLFWGVKVIKGYLKVHNAYFEARRKGRADGKKKT